MLITFIGCDDDDWIPYARVDITINLINLADLGLLQSRILQGGVNGIILFRLSDNEFNAFDRTCPYQPSKNCAVDADDTGMFAGCPCCDSEFRLLDGGNWQGPANRPLKQYRTSVSGNLLHIYN